MAQEAVTHCWGADTFIELIAGSCHTSLIAQSKQHLLADTSHLFNINNNHRRYVLWMN